MVRSIMSFAQLSDSFWGYAFETAIYILNNITSKSVSETSYELRKGRKGSLRHFRIWGCPIHVLVQNPKKLEHCSKLCLFVGYPKESRGCLFYDPQESKVFVSTNAIVTYFVTYFCHIFLCSSYHGKYSAGGKYNCHVQYQ